jgi:hypothetical protein
MRIARWVGCVDFPCRDTRHDRFVLPQAEVDLAGISVVMISEAAPENLSDYYYAAPDALFAQTTLLAFQEAGVQVASIRDILERGVYLTTAVKCGKTAYGIAAASVEQCSHLLEKEIALFPDVKAYLLMGDVAIRALNDIARRNREPRVIPAGSTYKIRSGVFTFRGARVFPSYLQAGPSFFIEKSKRRMIAQDIAAALEVAGIS